MKRVLLVCSLICFAGAARAQLADPSTDAIVRAINTQLPHGQDAAANSVPVTLARDKSLAVIPQASFEPVPAPAAAVRRGAAQFVEAMGRQARYVTDGVNHMAFAPPNKGSAPYQASAIVTQSPNPSLQCPYTASINQTASTTVITNTGGKAIHICSGMVLSTSAQGLTLAEGTGAACGTGTIYWMGGSGGTAQLAANGGFLIPGDRITLPMQSNGNNVCVIQSSNTNVSGYLTYGVF